MSSHGKRLITAANEGIALVTTAPSPFSAVIPKLQIAWDSTSLKLLMECPRKYQYTILEGWRTEESSVHLAFGGYFASAIETYKKARLTGSSKEGATIAAVRRAIEDSWLPATDEYPEGRPWGGTYDEQWRCTGTEPYRNSRGNRAKCPWSHKGVWLPAPSPGTCGECGSVCDTQRRWVADDTTKDRYSLIRLVVWYCEEQPERLEDGPHPWAFPDGTPAVELSFRMPLPFHSPWAPTWSDTIGHTATSEPYLLCGHLDSIMEFGSEKFISDNKTTKHALTAKFYAGYNPAVQMDVYDLAGSILYEGLNIKGVMIEGAQILKEGARFGIGVIYRNEEQREEFLEELGWWLKQAERYALDNYWPMNRSACYLCDFKGICSKSPNKREIYLEAGFVKKFWNPLEER